MFLKPSRHRDEATNASAVLDHDHLFFQRDQSPHKTKMFNYHLDSMLHHSYLSLHTFCNSPLDIKGDKLLSLIADLVHLFDPFHTILCFV